MREILFRGKRVDNGEWVYGDLQHDYNGEPRCISDYCGANPVDPSTVGQYTGLKDKNGKRIFEGDIVCSIYSKKNYPVCFGEYTYINDYGDEENACGWCNKEPGFAYYTAMGNTECWAVVVGNIHDPSELMEEKQ